MKGAYFEWKLCNPKKKRWRPEPGMREREAAWLTWHSNDLVFCSSVLNVTFPFTSAAEPTGLRLYHPKIMTAGGQIVPPQNRLLWPILSLLFWEAADTGVALESCPFMKRLYIWQKSTWQSVSSKKVSLRCLVINRSLWRLSIHSRTAWAHLVTWSPFLHHRLATLAPTLSAAQGDNSFFCFACVWCVHMCSCRYRDLKPLLGVFHSCTFIYFFLRQSH